MTATRLCLIASLSLVAASARAQSGVLVMPFENVTRDARIFWLGEASAVLLTDDVNALGGDAVTRQERKRAFARLQVPPAATLTDATLIRIGQVVGAAEIVVGTLQLEGDVLVVKARRIALDTGRVQATITERGRVAELFATFERVARQIAPPSQTSSEDIRRQHPSVEVFANFIKGLLAETPQTAVNYLWAALRAQPSFERARLALWDVYANQGDYGHALDAIAAIPADSPNARRVQFLTGLAKLELKQYEDAFKIFTALSEEQPTAIVLNNLGVLQLRRFAPAPDRAAGVFLRQGRQGRLRGLRLRVQPWLRVLAQPGRSGIHLLVARSGPPKPRRRGCALRAWHRPGSQRQRR